MWKKDGGSQINMCLWLSQATCTVTLLTPTVFVALEEQHRTNSLLDLALSWSYSHPLFPYPTQQVFDLKQSGLLVNSGHDRHLALGGFCKLSFYKRWQRLRYLFYRIQFIFRLDCVSLWDKNKSLNYEKQNKKNPVEVFIKKSKWRTQHDWKVRGDHECVFTEIGMWGIGLTIMDSSHPFPPFPFCCLWYGDLHWPLGFYILQLASSLIENTFSLVT